MLRTLAALVLACLLSACSSVNPQSQHAKTGYVIANDDSVRALRVMCPDSVSVSVGGLLYKPKGTLNPKGGTLHFNPLLFDAPITLPCASGGQSSTQFSPEQLRDLDFFYSLRNRDTIEFERYDSRITPVSVPIAVRPGFWRDRAQTDVMTSLSLGAMWVSSSHPVRYSYVRGSENSVDRNRGLNARLGLFLTLATAEADSSTTRGALSLKQEFVTVSPGVALLFGSTDLSAGLFIGGEVPVLAGSGVRKNWDYRYVPWIGFGIGVNPFKLF